MHNVCEVHGEKCMEANNGINLALLQIRSMPGGWDFKICMHVNICKMHMYMQFKVTVISILYLVATFALLYICFHFYDHNF